MRLHLRVVSGIQIGDECDLDQSGGLIGRGEHAQFCLHDNSVSRTHLELRYADGWWAIQHSTRSPTMVDGAVLTTQPLRLQQQGLLQIGKIGLEYFAEDAQSEPASSQTVAPQTMINIRNKLPALQQAVLPQMTPMRAPEPLSPQSSPTLILRRPSSEAAHTARTGPALVLEHSAPPTLIRPAIAMVPPPPQTESRAMTPVMPAPQLDHLRQQSGTGAATAPDESAQVRQECHQIRQERDQLRQECEQLRQERDRLHQERDRLTSELQRVYAQSNVSRNTSQKDQSPSTLPAQALQLLLPFSISLEQASDALKAGDVAHARNLIRDASFGLADLRDLFESSGT